MTAFLTRLLGFTTPADLGFLLTVLVAGVLGWLWSECVERKRRARRREAFRNGGKV